MRILIHIYERLELRVLLRLHILEKVLPIVDEKLGAGLDGAIWEANDKLEGNPWDMIAKTYWQTVQCGARH